MSKKEETAGPLKKKLETILLDKVEFEDATLDEILNFISQKSKELDPDKKGVSFILHDAELASGTDNKKPTIAILVEDIPMLDAIKYICRGFNSKFSIDENVNAVIIEVHSK